MSSYKTVIEALRRAGYEAYLVGGCVRDILRGREPQDYDVTTSALPEQVKEVFKNERVIETGLKHGTVTVLIDREPFEVTTFRVDEGYSDGRHPDSVAYTNDLTLDLSRRDFTVNAMAMDEQGNVIDPFGGREDLKRKIVRAVGDPEKRFEEDALRILRALRFSSCLGFEIEKNTAEAAISMRERLSLVSRERCFAELKKTLCGENIEDVLTRYFEIFAAVIPQIAPMRFYDQNNPHHLYTLDKHTAIAVAAAPDSPAVRFAALLHDTGKPHVQMTDEKGISHYKGHAAVSREISENVMTELRSDRKTKEKVCFLVEHHDDPIEENEKLVRRRIGKYGYENYKDLLLLRRADRQATGTSLDSLPLYDAALAMAEEAEREKSALSLATLALNGNDLISLGCSEGKDVGALLSRLLDAVSDGSCQNERGALLSLAAKWIENSKK